MYKGGNLNAALNAALGRLGHTELTCVSDCGLPIPDGPQRVDLAYKLGSPPFLEVLEVLAGQMVVEKLIFAQEILDQNPGLFQSATALFPGIPWEVIPHQALKELTRDCRIVVRTGEATPYANVILQSGCIF